MWRGLITSFLDNCKFTDPTTEKDVLIVEQTLGVKLPLDLKGLLFETNGVIGDYGSQLIWNLTRIRNDNLEFRNSKMFKEIYMPFDHLLFFADAGNGDQFAYSIIDASVRKDDIYVWNHEDDSRIWVAPSLEKYLEWWIKGKIKI